MNPNNTETHISCTDAKSEAVPPTQVLIKPIYSIFTTGEQILYSIISETGQSLAIFDTIEACKHYAKSNEYYYEFIN